MLRAHTFARFPGPHGRVYRLLVIDSRAHVLATRRILASVRRSCARSGLMHVGVELVALELQLA